MTGRHDAQGLIDFAKAAECLDWLARYVDAGARHLTPPTGSPNARPDTLAERLLPALRKIGEP